MGRMPLRHSRAWNALPIALSLPLLAGLAAFAAALIVAQVATRSLEREFAREAARLGAVYLDGISAALIEPLRAGDPRAIEAVLLRALGFQEGVREQRLVVVPAPGAAPIVVGAREDPALPPPFTQGRDTAWEVSPDARTAWAQRTLLVEGAPPAQVAAQLDFARSLERRAQLGPLLLGLEGMLAALAGMLVALLTRRALAPLLAVTEALDRAGAGDFRPSPAGQRPPAGTEAARLIEAVDLMAARLAERERLAARLAERAQAAELGDLAATVAHEVRNPLAGMLTALGSARRFGESRAAREEALDLVERGLRQIQQVVQATLDAHRGTLAPRPLTREDLEDVVRLVRPEAERRGLRLELAGELPEPFPADALPVRQALLNLLLNAVAATGTGGVVSLGVRREADGTLRLEVADEGGGLPEPALRQIEGGARSGPGLGLSVVMAQLARLDGRIEVDSRPGEATHIAVFLPPAAEGVAA